MPTCKIINGPSLKLALRELAYGPTDIHDLVDAVGIAKRNMQKVVNVGRAAGLIYIHGWQRHFRGSFTPIYGLRDAQQPDKPRPRPYNRSRQMQRYRARNRPNALARALPA